MVAHTACVFEGQLVIDQQARSPTLFCDIERGRTGVCEKKRPENAVLDFAVSFLATWAKFEVGSKDPTLEQVGLSTNVLGAKIGAHIGSDLSCKGGPN